MVEGQEYRLEVPQNAEGQRLDQFLTNRSLYLSRSRVQHLIESGQVLVNNKTRRSSYRVRTGDMIEMRIRHD